MVTKSAAKELESVPTKDRQRIVTKIGTLANNPRPVGAGELRGDAKYRMRQGDCSILFEIVGAELIVMVVCTSRRCAPRPAARGRFLR